MLLQMNLQEYLMTTSQTCLHTNKNVKIALTMLKKEMKRKDKETILQDIDNGMSQIDVAKKYGVSTQTISNWLKDNKSENVDDRKVDNIQTMIEDKLISL